MLWIEPNSNCLKVKSILDHDHVVRIELIKFSDEDRPGHSVIGPSESFNLASMLLIFSELIIIQYSRRRFMMRFC